MTKTVTLEQATVILFKYFPPSIYIQNDFNEALAELNKLASEQPEIKLEAENKRYKEALEKIVVDTEYLSAKGIRCQAKAARMHFLNLLKDG